jgi:hypothetical protein
MQGKEKEIALSRTSRLFESRSLPLAVAGKAEVRGDLALRQGLAAPASRLPKPWGTMLGHVAAAPQRIPFYKFLCVLRAQNTQKLATQLVVACGDQPVR